MKKLVYYLLSAMMILAVGCEGFDDSAIWDKLNSLEGRVAALEQLCAQMNTNITALQSVVEALENNDYVTNIAPITEDDKIIGYTITFSKSGSVTIYHGKDGQNGANGTNGTNGKNGVTPVIGVKKADDGTYYWTINGEWLLDSDGNKIKAQGTDGKNGENGYNGKNGTTPKLKIEDGYWKVSYDNGKSWEELGKATGEDGDSMFADVTYDDDYVYITLSDGTELVVSCHHIVPDNQIWYTSSDGKIVTPNRTNVFGVNIVSNTYENGKGVITFDGDVTSIGVAAFTYCYSLTSVTISNSVTSIGNFAFSGCDRLTSITIPDSVTEIGYYTFQDCSSLTSVTIPNSVTSIGVFAFTGCSGLISFYGKFASADNRYLIIDGVLHSFAPAGLTEYTIPDSVTSIGYGAFSDCSRLTSITIPDSVTEIGYDAFLGCSRLTSITIPSSVTSIEDRAFYQCSGLISFYGKFASADNRCLVIDGVLCSFAPAGLTEYTIPDSVTSIGYSAFCFCHNLTSITIPDSVTSIGNCAFQACHSLISVYCKSTTPPTLDGSYVFDANGTGRKIYVPTASVDAYKSAEYWSEYADAIVGYDF